MSNIKSLRDIIYEPMQPVDYELLKRGDIATSEEVSEQIIKDIYESLLSLIGSDEEQLWDSEYYFCNRCDWQPTDGSKTCLCKVRNKLRKELRTAIKEWVEGK